MKHRKKTEGHIGRNVMDYNKEDAANIFGDKNCQALFQKFKQISNS